MNIQIRENKTRFWNCRKYQWTVSTELKFYFKYLKYSKLYRGNWNLCRWTENVITPSGLTVEISNFRWNMRKIISLLIKKNKFLEYFYYVATLIYIPTDILKILNILKIFTIVQLHKIKREAKKKWDWWVNKYVKCNRPNKTETLHIIDYLKNCKLLIHQCIC